MRIRILELGVLKTGIRKREEVRLRDFRRDFLTEDG